MLKNNKITYKYKNGIAAFAAMAISLFASSCSNDEPLKPSASVDGISFTTSTLIGGASSRVSYMQNGNIGMKVRWEKNDVVYLFDDENNPLVEFSVQNNPIEDNKAIFTCTKIITNKDLSSVEGTLRYVPNSNVEPGVQLQNGSLDGSSSTSTDVNGGSDQSTKHLQADNVIQSKIAIKGAELLNNKITGLEFENMTCIFRIIFKAPRTSSEGASLTMYGADGWGVGIPLTLGFTFSENETIVAYIAAPTGTSGNNLNVALTDGTVENMDGNKRINTITTFSHESKAGMTYVPGNEYTADFTNDSGDSWDAEIDGDNEFVNLGLSVLWSTKNLGAKALTGDNSFGYYYAWGIPNQFTDENYPPVVAEDINPYNKDFDTLLQNKIIASVAYPDGKKVYQLAPKFDAATYYYYTQVKKEEVPTTDEISNSAWFTPTREQFEELLNKEKCTWVWNAALKGYEVVSKMQDGDKYVTLFMPAAGFKENGNTHNIGHYAYYWTSTPPVDNRSDTQNAWCMHISGAHRNTSGYISEDLYPRYRGMSIRPVKWPEDDAPKTDQTTGK